MKFLIAAFFMSLMSFSAFAVESKIHCQGRKLSLYEVIIQRGKELSKSELRALPANLKQKIIGAERVSKIDMVIFRGEATPQNVVAIGVERDVLLQVFSLTGPENLSLFLDEVGPQDISSILNVDGQRIGMNCQEM